MRTCLRFLPPEAHWEPPETPCASWYYVTEGLKGALNWVLCDSFLLVWLRQKYGKKSKKYMRWKWKDLCSLFVIGNNIEAIEMHFLVVWIVLVMKYNNSRVMNLLIQGVISKTETSWSLFLTVISFFFFYLEKTFVLKVESFVLFWLAVKVNAELLFF